MCGRGFLSSRGAFEEQSVWPTQGGVPGPQPGHTRLVRGERWKRFRRGAWANMGVYMLVHARA